MHPTRDAGRRRPAHDADRTSPRFLVHGDERPPALRTQCGRESTELRRRDDVPAEQDDTGDALLTERLAHVPGHGRAREAEDEHLANLLLQRQPVHRRGPGAGGRGARRAGEHEREHAERARDPAARRHGSRNDELAPHVGDRACSARHASARAFRTCFLADYARRRRTSGSGGFESCPIRCIVILPYVSQRSERSLPLTSR